MLDTRSIIMVPAANAVGYFTNRREELGVDPNRDFAYDTSEQSCMRTVAARALNELWRTHIFSFAITFHGGDNLLAFPWGDTLHCPGFPGPCTHNHNHNNPAEKPRWISPDHTAMAQMAKFSSDYAGPGVCYMLYVAHVCACVFVCVCVCVCVCVDVDVCMLVCI
jgi:hypothetical protein